MSGAARMRTEAIDIRSFFHGFAFGAAITAVGHLTATDWVFAFLGCHIVFSSTEMMLDVGPSSGEPVYSGRCQTPYSRNRTKAGALSRESAVRAAPDPSRGWEVPPTFTARPFGDAADERDDENDG